MNVVTKKINNYEAVIYKTKKYTTIHLDYIFLNEFTHRNFIIFDLLNRYMLNTNSKYKTKKDGYIAVTHREETKPIEKRLLYLKYGTTALICL